MTKEVRQVAMLSAMLLVIVGVLLYVYKDSLLPRPQGSGPISSTRINIPTFSDQDAFFDRQDYKDLRSTPGVPVQPLKVETKGVNPFVAPK